jgi:hypothetical protein
MTREKRVATLHRSCPTHPNRPCAVEFLVTTYEHGEWRNGGWYPGEDGVVIDHYVERAECEECRRIATKKWLQEAERLFGPSEKIVYED